MLLVHLRNAEYSSAYMLAKRTPSETSVNSAMNVRWVHGMLIDV